ncbi:MAG: hypothetical protein PHD05_00700 [Sphaerochaetaceae bacterium]|jgi:flagellar hook protein FlgE|nr:hypothetical protein [Sphaerochaetaceae bacterium]
MISTYCLFEINPDDTHVEKIEISKNYIIQDLKDHPPKEQIKTYKRKVVYDKDGNKHLLNIAILKNGKGTKVTSVWHDKDEKSARVILKRWKEDSPEKVSEL